MKRKISLNFACALVFLFCAGKAAAQVGDDTKLMRMLVDSASAALNIENYSEAARYLKEAEARITDQVSDSTLFDFHYFFGVYYNRTRKAELGIDHSSRALAIASGMKNRMLMQRAVSNIANIHGVTSNHIEALAYQRQALKLNAPDDSASYYGILNNMSNSYTGLGFLDSALFAQTRAKDYFKRVGNLTNQAIIETNIGEFYREQLDNHEMARKHYLNAILINKKLNAKSELARAYSNYSLSLAGVGQMDSARHYLYEALDLHDLMGNVAGKANIYHSLSSIFIQEKSYDKAISYLLKTKEIAEAYDLKIGIYHVSMSLAEVHQLLGNYKISLDNLNLALSMARSQGWMRRELAAIQATYELHKNFQRWENALTSLEAYNALNDSMLSAQSISSLNEIRARYETQLATSENEALLAQNKLSDQKISSQRFILFGLVAAIVVLLVLGGFLFSLIKRRNAALVLNRDLRVELEAQLELVKTQKEALVESNKFKNRVISVIGHDLRAPLINVVSVVQIARNSMEDTGIGSVVLDRLQSDTEDILKALNSLLDWSRTEMDGLQPRREFFDPNEVISAVLSLYAETLRQKDMTVDVHCEGSFWADQNQFRSIVTNLLSNAVKYSPEGSKLVIRAEEHDDEYVLFIDDKGEGISDFVLSSLTTLTTIKSKPGTKGERGTGLGLRLVREFAQAHNGEFELSRLPDVGTRAKVVFPKVEEPQMA